MKAKIIIISAILSAMANLSVSGENTDTVTTVIGAERLVITETPQGLKTFITKDSVTTAYEQTFPAKEVVETRFFSSYGLSLNGGISSKQSSVKWEIISGGVGFGFCSAPGAPSAAGIEMGKSFELSWLNILAVQARNRYGNSFSFGVGINWRNYRTTLANNFVVNDGQVEIGNYPEGVEPRLSRIKIFSVQFPLLYRQHLPFGITKERMSVTFGPIFNLNSHASVLSAWKTDDVKSEYKVNGINIRPFTIDLFASVHFWDFCSLYVRYSPYKAMTGNHPMNFHQFSTGILFFM